MTQPTRPATAATFKPVNEVESLLALAAFDPKQGASLKTALLNAELLLATLQPSPAGALTLKPGQGVDFLTVTPPDGTAPVAAVFTSPQRIVECYGPGRGFIQMRGAVLFEMVRGVGAMLNPDGAYSLYWTPQRVAALLDK